MDGGTIIVGKQKKTKKMEVKKHGRKNDERN
jgi:hypothetical protein